MTLNRTHISCCIVVMFLCLSAAFMAGYNMKQKPLYVNGKSFSKALIVCGIELPKDQQQALFEWLKVERRNK